MAKKTRKLNKKRLLTIACAVLLVYLGVTMISQECLLHSLGQQKQEIKKEIETVKAQGDEYKSTTENSSSADFVEKEARDKLGMVKDNELQFIVKPQE